MKKNLLLTIFVFCFITLGYSQADCATALALTPGTPQAGDTTGQAGSFSDSNTAPEVNPCSTNYNDLEYWFQYTAVETGETLDITVSDLTSNYYGVFIIDNCPDSTPTCVASVANGFSSADLVVSTPSLTAGTTYYIVLTDWIEGSTTFTMNSVLNAAPSCLAPTDFALTGFTNSSADLSWTENGTSALWNLEVVDITGGGTVTGNATETGVTNPYTLSGLTANNAYEVYVQADCGGDGLSAWVGPVAFFTGYCIPESTNAGTYTDSFTVTGALMNTSTTATGYTGTGYADYYDTNTIESFEGGAFDFSAVIVGGTAGFAVWVDWNNDLVFDAATETLFNTTSYGSGPFEGSITVPGGTAIGDYRLRTMVDYSDSNPNDDACAFGGTRGEVEDYKLTIASAPTDEMDFNNVQWVTDGTNGSDVSLTVSAGTAVTVYAKGYEAGVTDAAGQGAGVECWIAINNENTDPSTWDSALWEVATYGSDSGNDDEYAYTTSDTPAGTNYVAARWRLNNASFTYGGFNGTWDGTNNVSIELVVDPIANDDCTGAIALTVNADLECTVTTAGSIQYATASGDDEAACFGNENDDVWFSFVASAASHKIDLLNVTGTPTDLYHSVWSGACGTLTNVSCSDSNSSTASGLTIGETYLLRVNSYGSSAVATTSFDICIGTPPPPPANDDCANATEVLDLPYSEVVDATSATNNDGFISCDGGSAVMNDGVWFTFIPTVSGDIDLTITNVVGWDPEVRIFSGSCGTFTCVANADSGGSGVGETITGVAVDAGTQYWINVGYWSGITNNSEGPFQIDITGTALSVNQFNNESAFSYYPNPVKNTLTLNAQNTIEQVAMYNMLGQEVLRATPNTVDSDLDMSHLQTGTYFVKVTIANVTKTIRVIKQ